jgi:hypothetical protein
VPSAGGVTKPVNIYGRYRTLPEDTAEQAVQDIIDASSLTAQELIVRGLQYIYHGGAFESNR